jgi:HupE / UreJ protein
MRRCLGVALACLLPFAAWAHSSSTSYVTIVASGHDARLQWSIALRDLGTAIGLDANDDGDITWGELRARQSEVDAYALSRLHLSTGGADCIAGPVEHLADLLGDGGYAVLRTTLRCPVAIAGLDVRYGALFEIDPNHRALLNVTVEGVPHTGIASPSEPIAHFDASGGQFTLVRQFFQGGIEHLVAGADHVLFIVMLLAPLLLRPRPAAESPLPRLAEIVTLLTAFTVAHGLTLTLAVLGLAHVFTAVAELGIAATILVTAVDNIVPFLPRQRGLLAFGFGLIHGLGVAGGLGPLHLPAASLALALLSFSLGLEAAQIGIALAASPIAHVLRATPAVSHRMLPVLSGGVALLAVLWIGEGAQRLAATPAATVLSMQEIRYAA